MATGPSGKRRPVATTRNSLIVRSPAVAASLADPSPRKSRSVRISCCHGRHGDPTADALVRRRPIGAAPVLLAICGAFGLAAAGAVLAPPWFWVPLAVVAVSGGRRPGVPPHRRRLRRLADDRRRHAGDDAGRHRRPGGLPGHDRRGEGGGAWPRAAVHPPLRPLPRRVQSRPGVPGDVHRRAGAWAASRPHAGGQPALAAGIGGALRICIQPTVARLGPGDGARHRLDPAGVRGRRRGASPCGPAPGIHRQLRCAPGRPRRTGVPRRLLPRRDLCLPDRALPGRKVALAAAAGDEFPDPGADRRALAARLCGRRDRPDARALSAPERSRAGAAS